MTPTGLRLTDLSTKWGLVEVFSNDGSLNRQYTIDAVNADAVASGNRVHPDGCTQVEWNSGRVRMSTRPCDIGNCLELPNGHLIVNYGVDQSNNLVVVSLIDFPPDEWAKDGNKILVVDSYAQLVDVPYQRVNPGV